MSGPADGVFPPCHAHGLPDFSDTTTIGVLTAIGLALSAIAAITGIVSVRQGSRAWRSSSRPLLHMAVARHPTTGECTLTLLNAGGGTALGTTFLFVIGSSVARGFVGILEPGRRLVLTTDPMPDVEANPAGGLISCYEDDARTVAQAWFLTNARRRYRKRLWRNVPNDEEVFAEAYPNIPLAGLQQVAVHTPMLVQP